MSDDGCWIQVEMRPGLSPRAIADEIAAFWTKRGARLASRERSPLPLGSLGQRKLGYQVGPDDGGWCTVGDSERASADFQLAKHLASALGTGTRFFGNFESSGVEDVEKLFGERAPAGKTPGTPGQRYPYPDDDDDSPGEWLLFEDVPADTYDPGPQPKEKDDEDDDGEVALYAAVAKRDWRSGEQLLRAAKPKERTMLLSVFFEAKLDLADARTCEFLLNIGRAALELCKPHTGQMMRIAEAAARSNDAALLGKLKARLADGTHPTAPTLLQLISRRLDSQGAPQAGEILRSLAG